MTPDATTPDPSARKKRAVTRRCPMCGNEAWRIAYGMMPPSARERVPKTVFEGCMILMESRENPASGKTETGAPKWVCQNPDCRHRWW
ncbi:hypothetical protein [Arthrobacter sp. ov407]|uniref:hypothetical protein n=1 Tax=Arthrobacter sp. ov407 TaxID=1761748 RepID=UPI00115FBF53|nr:hypothetical protein [Arthrobacter sp. ov407]